MLPGVGFATKKNGICYYRSSITFKGKHISLGSYPTEDEAHKAYCLANEVLCTDVKWNLDSYPPHCIISYHKWVVLHNFKDNLIYFKNPIYLKQRYFLYFINQHVVLKFDVDDLFYYAHHKILKRGGHLFVSDYGMQVNILSRYGIKNYAVAGRDYLFVNGDDSDYRYGNIEIVNRYHGVTMSLRKGLPIYIAKILINGNYIIGNYPTDYEAAIAYNKAALLLQNKGFKKRFPQNYIEEIDEIRYASIYQRLRISNKLLTYIDKFDEADPEKGLS